MTAEPRPGLREVAPYVSPQLDVAARLNTNECPLPLPARVRRRPRGRASATLALNRYPDGQMRELRDAIAGVTGHPVEGIVGRGRVERDPHRSCSPPTAAPVGER